MAYVGDELSPLFRHDPAPVIRAICEAAAHEGLERAKENTPVETGRLRESWYRVPANRARGLPGKSFQARIATDVDYAPYVEHGTGLYGPRHEKYPIRPRRPGGVLRFVTRDGRTVFAREVMHPGSPGQHMLAIAMAAAEHELRAIADPIARAWIAAIEADAEGNLGGGLL